MMIIITLVTNNKLSNGPQHWLEPEREEEPAPAPPSASEELGQSLLQLMAAQVMLYRTKMDEQYCQCIVLLLLVLLLMVLSSPSAVGRAGDVRDDYDIHDDVDD